MLDGIGGSVCQIVATVGRGMPGIAHTGAARAGVLELSRGLAYEWGPRVRVNCLAPGLFRTAGFADTYEDGVGEDTSEHLLPYAGRTEHVANGAVFLVSPAAAFIIGEVLYVDGGQMLQGHINALPLGSYEEWLQR